jgi:hypothetical protein
MSLTSGLKSPRTPLRRFLDRELSAGARPLRESFRAQYNAPYILLPPPGVGTEAGTVGTAIDQRLRLAFSAAAPVDEASLIGIQLSGEIGGPAASRRMLAVGQELIELLGAMVYGLALDVRDQPLERAQDEEEALARMLLAAAWYQVACRNLYGFTYTPLFMAAIEEPEVFTLKRLLALTHQDLVDDVVAQVYEAAGGPLAFLRESTTPADCRGGPTFTGVDIAADADLLVDGLLIDFKSTRRPDHLSKQTAWQLLGYLLLDIEDRHRIDTLGIYLTRSATLVSWPVDDYLALLGTRRRNLPELRGAFAELLAGCSADADPQYVGEDPRSVRLLEELAAVIASGHCPVCAQPLPAAVLGTYCSRWCSVRGPTLQKRGWLPPQTGRAVRVTA